MLTQPHAKINLGLNVVERRADGYHNLETVFFPVPICDTLEICEMDDRFPSESGCDLKSSGNAIEGSEQHNLVVKAYRLLAENYRLPRLHIHLHKQIPTQAGMGGGSSDAAFMLRMLNDYAHLQLQEDQLVSLAAKLGADCPFFILDRPAYAEGIGEKLKPVQLSLGGWWLAIVKPDIPVSTREAFSLVKPKKPAENCLSIVSQPVATWRDRLVNDFEASVFAIHPEIGGIKQRLYDLGATFALMTGSGSSLFAMFEQEPSRLGDDFPDDFTWCGKL